MAEQKPEPALPAFFDKNPELKARLIAYLKTIPEEDKKRQLDLFRKFINGEMTWAEVKRFPKALLKELTKAAYLKFQLQEYKSAEVIFKGLAILDHTNWYYRTALGAIYQKQGLWQQAVEEYSLALALKPDEATSLLNRGECYLRMQDFDAALEDFAALKALPLPEASLLKKRAGLLSQKIVGAKA